MLSVLLFISLIYCPSLPWLTLVRGFVYSADCLPLPLCVFLDVSVFPISDHTILTSYNTVQQNVFSWVILLILKAIYVSMFPVAGFIIHDM